MLWTIAVVLIILWMLGLGTGFTMGSFIHILYVAAIALLVVSLSQEVMINRKLRDASRSCGPKPDGKQRRERYLERRAVSRSGRISPILAIQSGEKVSQPIMSPQNYREE